MSETKNEKLPASLSQDPSNVRCVWCEAHGQRRHYRSCLHLIDAYKAGRLQPEDAQGDCANAMYRHNCVAVNFRKEELEKGQALYYEPKRLNGVARETTPEERKDPSYWRGWNQVGSSKGKEHQSAVTTKSALQVEQMDHGQIVTDLAAKKVEPQKPLAERGITMEQFEALKAKIEKTRAVDPVKAAQMLARAEQLVRIGGEVA